MKCCYGGNDPYRQGAKFAEFLGKVLLKLPCEAEPAGSSQPLE